MSEIKTVGVLGAGTMGAGIAIVAARAGFATVVFDTNDATLARSARQTEGFFKRSVDLGRMSGEAMTATLARFTRTADPAPLGACDIVIEAVYEDLQVKHAALATAYAVCPPHTIFASNTSTLSITEIAAGSGRPERVVGMHFCLPAQLMKLVEMSPGLATSEATFAAAWAFCERLGQTPVRTKDAPGFILNYFVVPFNNDVIRLIEAGVAAPAAVDAAITKGLGWAMGPCRLLDLIGLDTQVRLCEAFHAVTQDPRAAAPPLLRRMVAAGQLGRKSGRGFYAYDRDAMFGG